MESNCISCNESILQVAIFCHNCGSQQKCKSCQTQLVKGANNCIGCGISLSKSSDSSKAINTVEYKETATERGYKMEFTDEVGSNMVSLMQAMLENQSGNQFLKLEPNKRRQDESHLEDVTIIEERVDETTDRGIDIPHIDDITRTIECSEPYWILIYAFYHSNHGKDSFSRSEIQKIYKDQRGTASRMGNFASNWDRVIDSKYIKTIKDGVLQLTDTGIKIAIGVINKEIVSAPKSSGKKVISQKSNPIKEKAESGKKVSKTSAKSIKAEEFDAFKNSKKPSLEDFIKERSVNDKSSYIILAIAYYMKTYCQSNFTDGNIEYAYKILKLTPILHLRQTITNQKTKHLWFSIEQDGTWSLTRAGSIDFEKLFPSK